MEYLVRKKTEHRKVYHLWDGRNTFCKMYLNGGMVKSKHVLLDEIPPLRICNMCEQVEKAGTCTLGEALSKGE